MFFSQYLVFPCQYHSTIALYSFIHLQPTLYNLKNSKRRETKLFSPNLCVCLSQDESFSRACDSL